MVEECHLDLLQSGARNDICPHPFKLEFRKIYMLKQVHLSSKEANTIG